MFHIVGACRELILENGNVQYNTEAARYEEGTEAIFSCNEGYSLSDNSTLICVNDDQLLRWNTDPPTCQRERLNTLV